MSSTQTTQGPISLRRIFALGMAAILAVVIIFAVFMSFEKIDADEILVVQSPFEGTLTWYITAGVKPQWFGKVTTYKKRASSSRNSF